MYLLNLHTTPKGHLIKTGTFLQKKASFEKNIRSHDNSTVPPVWRGK